MASPAPITPPRQPPPHVPPPAPEGRRFPRPPSREPAAAAPPVPGGGEHAAAPGGTASGPGAVAPERQRQIADWAAGNSDHSGGFLGIGGTESSTTVRDALAGRSELGPMSPPEQRVLADRMIDRWEAGRGDGPSGPARLVDALQDAPDSRAVLGEALAARAAAIGKAAPRDPDKPDANWEQRARASSYARSAVEAAGGADDPAAPGRLRDMISRVGPEAAGGFAGALPDLNPLDGLAGSGDGLSRTLSALADGQPGAARSSFVQNAFAATQAEGYADVPDRQGAMARAVAAEWHPDDPAAAGRDADRLAGILATDQGRRLLGDGGKDGPALATRVDALATVRADPAITGDALRRTDDPWTNPAVIAPTAQAGARQYLDARGDAPLALAGTDLDNTVGTAMGQAPAIPPGTDPARAEADAARGAFNYYGTGAAAEPVRTVADQIRGIAGNGSANVTVLPVTYSDGKTGPVQVPLFRVADPAGAERYVDNTGRRYDDFEDWRTHNALPPGTQVYPEGGHLRGGPDGRVALAQDNTPKTVDTFGEHVSSVVDKAALVGGIVAGGVLIVGTGGLAAPVVAAAGAVAVGAGAWGAYRSGSELIDRGEHGQSLDPVTDSQARGLWLNLGASVAAVGAFGSAARLAQLGRAGGAVAPLEASLHGYVQAGSFALDTAAVANQGVDTARNWNRMSTEERASSILQLGFWGVGAGVGMRATGTRNPGDMFNPIKVRDNLLAANPPTVTADPALPGNAVKIDYDTASGVVRGIRHGPEATPADIALHQRTAQNIQRSLTLEGQVSRLLGGDAPPPGTVGWAARQDIAKVRERLDTRLKELERPDLTQARRGEIEAANSVDRQHLDDLSDEVASYVRDPAAATIDARNTNRSTRAERQSLPVGDTTVRYGRNEATWTVNALHETIRARAVLREIPPHQDRPRAESDLTSAVGREGEVPTRAYPDRDDGGHMIGYQFLHDQGLINMFPQNAQNNEHVYTRFESEMRGWVEAGGEVRVTVEVGGGKRLDNGEAQWGGSRPARIGIEFEVVNPKTGKVVYTQQSTLKNRKGETYDGLGSQMQRTGGREPEPREVAAEMRRRLGL